MELGSADIDIRMEEILIDGILYSFQEQSVEDVIISIFLFPIFNFFLNLGCYVEWFRNGSKLLRSPC